MQKTLALLALLLAPTFALAQDGELRARADSILESAHAVSVAPNLPNLERIDSFQVFDTSASAREGSFSRVVVQGIGRREETNFGEYHLTQVWAGETLASTGSTGLIPADVKTVMLLTPIYLVRFDESDVIRSIKDQRSGGHLLQCIAFDTIVGQTQESNEVCFDASSGALVTEKLGGDYIENSNFFPFAGALFPGKINYSVQGTPKLEISQTMAALEDSTANVLAAPPGAEIRNRCATFRRAIGQFMPQPAAMNRGPDVDIVVRGIIGRDGKVQGSLVQSSERSDLNTEALSTVAQWTFLPALCNGQPNPTEASFVVHFHGR